MSDRRMMLVHAHPDDETITNGVTMAKYAAAGVAVTLVTCTRGEEGEVLVPELGHLAAAEEDRLGERRETELADAMAILGVRDHRFLGGPGRWRDSGMMGLPENDRPGSFWRADLVEAATELVRVIREVRPQVLLTYDDFGGYGHPDHIQAHRVATYGVSLAAIRSFRPDTGEAWDVPKVYWAALPRSVVQEGIDRMRELGSSFFGVETVDDFGMTVPDDLVSTAIDGQEYVPQKMDAMRAHATQIAVDGPFFALSNNLGLQVWGTEHYRIAKGTAFPDVSGRETDLFAGLD